MVESLISIVKGIVEAIKQKESDRKNLGARMIMIAKDNTQILQILDNLMEIAQLSLNRQKFNKTVEEILE